jgi:hypothetical protein
MNCFFLTIFLAHEPLCAEFFYTLFFLKRMFMKKYLLSLFLLGSLSCGPALAVRSEANMLVKYGYLRLSIPYFIQKAMGCNDIAALSTVAVSNLAWMGLKSLLVDAEVMPEEGPQKGKEKVFTSLGDDLVPGVGAVVAGASLLKWAEDMTKAK